MRLKCIHGYFMFFETSVGQVSDFIKYSGFDILPKSDYYTFEELLDVPQYSIAGAQFMGNEALTTFESKNPYRIFEENQLVFDFTSGTVKPISSVSILTKISQAGNRYVSNGLIVPGSKDQRGNIVTGFDAWFSRDRLTWLYTEVSYE